MSRQLMRSYIDLLNEAVDYSHWLKIVKVNPYAINTVPEQHRTLELCSIAVQKDPNLLIWVPETIQQENPKLLLDAVSQKPESIKAIKEHLRTYDICLVAIKKDGTLLQYVPYHLKIKTNICVEAVNQTLSAFIFVPQQAMNQDLVDYAVRKKPSNIMHVPLEFQTEELCKLVVENNPSDIKFIKETKRTKEMCEYAIKKAGGYLLSYVPRNLRTYEMCDLALEHMPDLDRNNPYSGVKYEAMFRLHIPKEFHERLTQKYKNKIY